MSRLALLLTLSTCLIAQARAETAPPYGYSLKGGACASADKDLSPSPWEAFSADEWAKMDSADQSAVVSKYCSDGPAYLSQYMSAKGRLAVPGSDFTDSERLSMIQSADADTKSSLDGVCNGTTDDGRSACKFCCQRLVDLHAKLIKQEGAIAQKTQDASVQKAVKSAQFQDAKRLAAAGLGGDVDEQDEAGRRAFDNDSRAATRGPAATINDDAAVGNGEAKTGAPMRDRDLDLKPDASAPPEQTLDQKEQAYIDNARKNATFGFGWAAAHDAKMDVEEMHGYYQNCYVNHGTTAPCQVCPGEANPSPDGYCKSELLLRQLGEK